jgi:hypothetical protein
MPSRPGGVDELRRECLHPSVHSDVIDSDAAFGQQFLDAAVGQAVPEVPAHRHRDQLAREAISGWTE